MFCPNCGTQNAETAPTCAKCGFQLKQGQAAAAPKFKGTMLMMNQPGAPVPGMPGAPPPAAPPPGGEPASGPAPSFQAEAPPIGAGAPPAGAAAQPASRLKGTIVGVAPPSAANPGMPPMGGPPPGDHQSFGSAQGVNALAGTVAFDQGAPAFGQQPGMDPNAPPPGAYGAPPPGGAPPYGAPPPGAAPYGAPPPGGAPYGAPPPQDFNQQMQQGFQQVGQGFQQAGQQLDQAFNPGGMQPYGQQPMMPGGQPGMMGPPGEGKPWMITLVLCLLSTFGFCGIHRFYVGKIGSGIAQFLTFGGCGLWQLYDLVMILTNKFTDAQGRPLVKQ